jgi:hypothetical protein
MVQDDVMKLDTVVDPILAEENAAEWDARGLDSEKGLAEVISEGIERRGFHLVGREGLAVLWGGGRVSATEMLQALHGFATRNGWEAAARNRVETVLFQPTGRRKILPSIWRLKGPGCHPLPGDE